MKKKVNSRKLTLDKLTVTKLSNPLEIKGGNSQIGTRQTFNQGPTRNN
ncbi:class I lanthipeptide [Aquimarina sp. 2201CG1-2-11]